LIACFSEGCIYHFRGTGVLPDAIRFTSGPHSCLALLVSAAFSRLARERERRCTCQDCLPAHRTVCLKTGSICLRAAKQSARLLHGFVAELYNCAVGLAATRKQLQAQAWPFAHHQGCLPVHGDLCLKTRSLCLHVAKLLVRPLHELTAELYIRAAGHAAAEDTCGHTRVPSHVSRALCLSTGLSA